MRGDLLTFHGCKLCFWLLSAVVLGYFRSEQGCYTVELLSYLLGTSFFSYLPFFFFFFIMHKSLVFLFSDEYLKNCFYV